MIARSAGWTPLHYAAVLSPPTLVSHFLKSGCSPFLRTRRNLTALDLITGHSLIPGRETVALLLEEAMRSEGWAGGRMEERRKALEERTARLLKRNAVREDVNRSLCIDPAWWGESESDIDSDGEGEADEVVYVSFRPHQTLFRLRSLITDSSGGLGVYAGFLSSVATGDLPLAHNELPDRRSQLGARERTLSSR